MGVAERYGRTQGEVRFGVCEPSRTMKGTGHASLLDFCGDFLGHELPVRVDSVLL